MFPASCPFWLRYGVAILGVSLALLLHPLFADFIETQIPFLLLFIAVIASAWYGGLGPGLLTTILATLTCAYFYVPPIYSFVGQNFEDTLELGLFALEGSLISFLSAALHQAQQRNVITQLKSQQQSREVAKRTAELSEANTVLQAQIAERLKTEAWLRKDAERLAAIIATQHDIATAELDLLRVMHLITERTQNITAANGAVILLPNGDDMVYRVASGSAASHVGLRVKIDQSFSGQCFRSGEVMCCNNTEIEPRVSDEVYHSVGARSLIAVPLRYERKISGVLKVLSSEINAFSDQDAHTLQMMAGFIAAAVIHAAEFEARQAMVMEHSLALAALRASEERFKSAFHDSAVGMALVSTNGQFLQVNRSLCRMLGYTEAELRATNFQALTHPHDLDCDLTYICQMLTGEIQTYELEKRYLHKEGQPIWVLSSVSLVHKPTGDPIHFIAQIQDITERKQAEEERAQLIREQAARAVAEAAEQRSAFLAEASAVLASSLDYEATLKSLARLAVPYLADLCVIDMLEPSQELRPLTVAHFNPVKEELAWRIQQCYPLTLSQLRPVAEVLETGEPMLIAEVAEDTIAAATNTTEYSRLIHALGPKSVIIVPLTTSSQRIGIISFAITDSERCYNLSDLELATDLARRAALAVENARLYKEAQDANRMKDEFLATLSHELRTPLNSVLGWSRLLQTRSFDAHTTQRALETIERNAKSQAQLIEDILDVSRIVRGKLQLHVRPMTLIPVITAAIESIRPAAEAKGIQLFTELCPNVAPVLGDRDRLQQIVWNLLSNAIKFTPNGGNVQISLTQSETQIQIQVQDSGQGISADFLPHVFDRFRQADSTITRSHGGLGLGLAIVRHLVELQGGTVIAASPGEGQGATFTVHLPALLGPESHDHRPVEIDASLY